MSKSHYFGWMGGAFSGFIIFLIISNYIYREKEYCLFKEIDTSSKYQLVAFCRENKSDNGGYDVGVSIRYVSGKEVAKVNLLRSIDTFEDCKSNEYLIKHLDLDVSNETLRVEFANAAPIEAKVNLGQYQLSKKK